MKFSRLILANLFRKKIRLILTIGSFAIALVLFTFLAVVKSAFSRGTEIAGADRLVVVSRIGLMQLMPISHRDKILSIAGARTAARFHWKIGDRIPIKTTLWGVGSSEFNLDGIYHSERPGGDESQFWLQWKYFDENAIAAVKSTAGWYVVKLDNPDDAARVAKAIDEKFANSSFETKTETESAFAAYFAKQFGN